MDIIHETSYGIILVHRKADGKYLFCVVRRALGHWSFPKGHKDANETDEETARREVFEETGNADIARITNFDFIETYSFTTGDTRHEKTVKYFLGKTPVMQTNTSQKFKNEICDVRWVSYTQLVKQLTFPESKKLAVDAYKYLYSKD